MKKRGTDPTQVLGRTGVERLFPHARSTRQPKLRNSRIISAASSDSERFRVILPIGLVQNTGQTRRTGASEERTISMRILINNSRIFDGDTALIENMCVLVESVDGISLVKEFLHDRSFEVALHLAKTALQHVEFA